VRAETEDTAVPAAGPPARPAPATGAPAPPEIEGATSPATGPPPRPGAGAPIAEPAGETVPAPPAVPGRAARPLPSFRPVPGGQTAVAAPEAEPLPELSLTLSEAIDLVHEAGGDAMELRFLRRELQRKGGDGNEPPELWGRIEQAVTGRLRRTGRLADGQPLTLRRDP
jgi:hypothetical protein